MFGIRLCLLVYVNLLYFVNCSFPVEILCVNPTCKEPISKALGSVTYASSSRNVLSFKPGQEITIISKSKNKNDYWGAIINGRSGYVPSNLIKEVKVFHRLSDLIPVSVESLLQNASTETKDTNLPESINILKQNTAKPVAQDSGDKLNTPLPVPIVSNGIVSNTGAQNIASTINNLEKSLGAAPLRDSDLEKNLPLDDTYNVIEGTTVYIDKANQITPSPSLDVKSNPQTTVPVEEIKVDVPMIKQERATIPPEVINFNADYKGQLLMKQNNLTIENEDEEDDEEEDFGNGADDDDDAEGDDEEIDESEDDELSYKTQSNQDENTFHTTESATHFDTEEKVKSYLNDNPKEKMLEIPNVNEEKLESVTIGNTQQQFSTQPVLQNVNSEAEENKTDENIVEAVKVNVVENSVTSKISTSFGTDNNKVAEEKIKNDGSVDSTLSPSILENNVEVSTQANMEQLSNENMFITADKLGDIKTNEPYLNVLSQSLYEKTAYSQHIGEQPVTPETPYTLNEKAAGSHENIDTKNNNLDIQKPTIKASEVTPPSIEVATEPSPVNSFQSFENTVKESVTESVTNKEILLEDSTEALETTTQFRNAPSEVVPDIVPEVREEFKSDLKEPRFFSQLYGTVSGWFGSSEEEENIVFKDLGKVSTDLSGDLSDKIKPNLTPEKLNTISQEPHHESSMNSNGAGVPAAPEEEQQQQPSFWNSWFLSSVGFMDSPTSSNTFLYLVITAVTVLLFTLGHNLIEKKGKTGPLIAKINKLEQKLLVTSKECILLKDEVQSAREKIILYENSANDELVLSLQTELEECKKQKAELESSIDVLQQELDAATEAGLDLNKMLSEVLTQKGGSETLMESVESLQAQLNSQQKVINEMTKKLGVKNQENEMLQTALDAANEKTETLEEQLNDMKHNLNIHLKEKDDLTQDLKTQINQLQIRINQLSESKEKEILQFKKKLEDLQSKNSETSKALAVKEEEFKELKESIKKLKTKGNINLETVFDVSRIKAELANALKESQALQVKLKEEESRKNSLEEKLKALDIEAQNLKKSQEEAEMKKDEAEKKLEVLSNYFKEKETQLQKELGLQEALWAQKKGDEKAVYNMMKSLQEEVESYKSQNETLKKEILDQERGLKNQIATLEQKAHENWVAARQAERKLEENKQETAQLRNRLTLIEKNASNNLEFKANHRTSEELNGEPTSPVLHDTSSPLLFPPLPLDPGVPSLLPPGFMPPPMFMPPPPFLPGDRRPPPLGRMSSPPLNSRFSPSSPAGYPPFERMSSPPLSPPARNYRSPNEADRDREHYRRRTPPYPPLHHRNLDDSNEMLAFIPISGQRDSVREHKGSNISSGHSSSDSIDKSSRHSGRV